MALTYIELGGSGGSGGSSSSVEIPLPDSGASDVVLSYDPATGEITDSGVTAATMAFQGSDLVLRYGGTAISASVDTNIVGVTDTSGLRTITLLTAALTPAGRIIIVKDESGAAGTNNITIDTQGAEKIDGENSVAITANYGCVRLYTNGTHWFSF